MIIEKTLSYSPRQPPTDPPGTTNKRAQPGAKNFLILNSSENKKKSWDRFPQLRLKVLSGKGSSEKSIFGGNFFELTYASHWLQLLSLLRVLVGQGSSVDAF